MVLSKLETKEGQTVGAVAQVSSDGLVTLKGCKGIQLNTLSSPLAFLLRLHLCSSPQLMTGSFAEHDPMGLSGKVRPGCVRLNPWWSMK
jgi:hypothetical protein